MKIRWTRHSLRLRITPAELAALERGEPVQEDLVFPGGGRWTATIQPGTDGTALTASGAGACLHLAADDCRRLAQPETEGVYFQVAGERPVRYFVEKDFPCAHPRAADAQEPPSDTFAAPA